MAIAIRARDVFAELPAAVAASNGLVGQVCSGLLGPVQREICWGRVSPG